MANECTSKALYGSLKHCPGTPITPGIRQRVYYIPKRDIVSFPELPNVATTDMAELASYKGNFVLASDKKWLAVDLVLNKGNVTCESQGEHPSRTFLNKFSFSAPSTDEKATAFARQANSDFLVFLVQERNGKFRVIGNEAFEADTKPTISSGEGTTGESGLSGEVEVTDFCPAPFYPGEIETEDGKISGATGKPIV